MACLLWQESYFGDLVFQFPLSCSYLVQQSYHRLAVKRALIQNANRQGASKIHIRPYPRQMR